MKNMVLILVFTILVMICWGIYGPVLQIGSGNMRDLSDPASKGGSLRPFICVGLAYFVIAVLVPSLLLKSTGEKGHWTASGTTWSLISGAAGAIGALGVILALKFGGHSSALYVMPLIFGCAPVVNTFVTMFLSKTFDRINPIFIAGLILVVAGAVMVLIFKPAPHAAPAAPGVQAPHEVITWADQAFMLLFTAMTALSWGFYGPALHKGQAGMGGSRLRPFLCVGISYFLIGVIVPVILLGILGDPGQFTFSGSLWSVLGGATGAVGALGIIMAFRFGGKPIYVMPLVFGGAPVISTLVAVARAGSFAELTPQFFAGLMVVVAGAITVLIFAPKAGHAPAAAHAVGKPAPART